MSFSTSYVPLLGSDFRVLCPFSLNLLTSVKLTALAPRWRRRRIAARAEQQREASPQTFRATTLGSVLPTRAAGPLRGQRPCGCCPSTRHGRAAAGRAAVGEQLPGGSPRRAFAPREAEVCVGPLLAAAPNGHRRARGHRRAALPRASSSSQSSATAGCSGRSARQAAARPHCDVTLEARAAPALPLPDAEQLVAPLFRLLAELRVPTEDYAADDVTYYDA